MTGARTSDNPWKRLAAEIINRARADCKGSVSTGGDDNITRALLQYDAEHWLESDPWCQYLLDCALPWKCDVLQSHLVTLERQRRRKSYRKYLPKNIDPDEQLPIYHLAKTMGLSKTRLNKAASAGHIEATQRNHSASPIWCTSISEIAKAVAKGDLVLRRK